MRWQHISIPCRCQQSSSSDSVCAVQHYYVLTSPQMSQQ